MLSVWGVPEQGTFPVPEWGDCSANEVPCSNHPEKGELRVHAFCCIFIKEAMAFWYPCVILPRASKELLL